MSSYQEASKRKGTPAKSRSNASSKSKQDKFTTTDGRKKKNKVSFNERNGSSSNEPHGMPSGTSTELAE